MTAKKRWLIGLGVGIPVALAAMFAWLNRTPSTPSFVANHPHELMQASVIGYYKRLTSYTTSFNVQSPIDTLLDEIQRTGGPKDVEPMKGYKGYFIRYRDPSSPILNIQLTQGRTAWSKSFFYYDNQYPASFSDGWTSVQIFYRQTLRSWLASYWEIEVSTRLHGEPPKPERVLVTAGLTPDPKHPY